MALKVKKQSPSLPKDSGQIEAWEKRVHDIYGEIDALKEEQRNTLVKIAAAKLMPFKVGDEVMFPVKQGRTTKEQKCRLEISEEGNVIVRPYKNDGELSGRTFNVFYRFEKTFDLSRLKKV